MDESTEQIINTINNLSYDKKKEIYSRTFSLGIINNRKNNSVDDEMILFSLVSLTYMKLKEKNPYTKPIDILLKIMKPNLEDKHFRNTLESLSILIEDLCYGCNTASSCGLKNSNEIINKIKELLTEWTPF
jgi:hypothetical protein